MANCNEDGCKVLSSGECINGLPLTNCTHYSINDTLLQEDQIPGNKDTNDSKISSHFSNAIETHSGRALKVEEVNRISSSWRTKLIILAGMPNAGKTTLLLSLMHLFATKSNFEGYIFAGSETLYDFEEKGHPSKIDSDNNNPDTDRTILGPPTFLHLKVARQDTPDKKQDFLFTDISGESFRSLKDSTEEAKKFYLGKRADHFALFFDSHMLSSIDKRASAKIAGLGILRSLTEAGTLRSGTQIQIIFSRWDLFKAKTNAIELEAFFTSLKEDINRLYSGSYQLNYFEVSSRSTKNLLPVGYGLEKLFPLWYNYSLFDHPQNAINKNTPSNAVLKQSMQYKFQ